MNEDDIKKEEQDLEDDIFLVPEEVQDFVWSDAFDAFFDIAEKVIPLSPEEKKFMKLASYDIVLRNIPFEDAGKWLLERNIEKEKVVKMLYIIETELLKYVKAFIEEETEEELPEAVSTPSPKEALMSIQERLSKPSAIAPIKRDYSLDKPASEAPVSKPSFDIYREIPEK